MTVATVSDPITDDRGATDAAIDPPMFLDRAALSHHLRLGLSTIDRLIATGKLPAPDVRIGSRIRLWARATIERWRFDEEGHG